jgi:hypothetical protein
MKNVTGELREIVTSYTIKIEAIPDFLFSAKPLPEKWSKKEVLGHLIDSAQNNLRRFICGQYEMQPPVITYQQDFWVGSNQYQTTPKEEVIQLWRLLNLRICAVLENMPAKNYTKECNTGSLHTLQWLAGDYVKHLKHHMNQIISGSFDVVYP